MLGRKVRQEELQCAPASGDKDGWMDGWMNCKSGMMSPGWRENRNERGRGGEMGVKDRFERVKGSKGCLKGR